MTTVTEFGMYSEVFLAEMAEHEIAMAEIHDYVHAEFCGQLNFLKGNEPDKLTIFDLAEE